MISYIFSHSSKSKFELKIRWLSFIGILWSTTLLGYFVSADVNSFQKFRLFMEVFIINNIFLLTTTFIWSLLKDEYKNSLFKRRNYLVITWVFIVCFSAVILIPGDPVFPGITKFIATGNFVCNYALILFYLRSGKHFYQ